jgi:hypothetical protein
MVRLVRLLWLFGGRHLTAITGEARDKPELQCPASPATHLGAVAAPVSGFLSPVVTIMYTVPNPAITRSTTAQRIGVGLSSIFGSNLAAIRRECSAAIWRVEEASG